MIIDSVLIVAGFFFLIFGANWLVNGASALAKKYKISDLAIGLTIVAFGTSAPEFVVNSIASFQNHSDIVYGNIIGSNNFNLFVILGIVGLILPIKVQSSTVWKEIPISLFAAIILLFLSNNFFFNDNQILSRLDGGFLFIMFGLFLWYVYSQLKTESNIDVVNVDTSSNIKIVGLIVLGLSGLIFGGKLVVDNSIVIATTLGVSEKIIGLTIIAAGTSLPELVTSIVAALKKNSDIAIGNVIGSNIFNIFLIISASSLINPIVYNISFNTDLLLLIFGTVFLFAAMFTGEKKKLDRWEAGLLLVTFVLYTIYQISKEVQ